MRIHPTLPFETLGNTASLQVATLYQENRKGNPSPILLQLESRFTEMERSQWKNWNHRFFVKFKYAWNIYHWRLSKQQQISYNNLVFQRKNLVIKICIYKRQILCIVYQILIILCCYINKIRVKFLTIFLYVIWELRSLIDERWYFWHLFM